MLDPTAVVSNAVALTDPAATSAAKDAKSATNADLIATVSPADTDDDVIESLV